MTMRQDIDDVLDASMEMPKQYGSRGYWRYQHVSGLIGLVVLPLFLILNAIDIPAEWDGIVTVAGIAFALTVSGYFIRRDHIVQKRIDQTGSPLLDRDPY